MQLVWCSSEEDPSNCVLLCPDCVSSHADVEPDDGQPLVDSNAACDDCGITQLELENQ